VTVFVCAVTTMIFLSGDRYCRR